MTACKATDHRYMAAALALSERGKGRTGGNPNVGCVIVKQGRVIGRGFTQPGGRPHAEAMALAQVGNGATGSDVYVTLEPCAHDSERGPACVELLIAARPARVIVALTDVDPRTKGKGIARLQAAGIIVDLCAPSHGTNAADTMAGYIMRQSNGRPYITLKLATSLDGAIAMADGTSRWITGDAARAHGHIERSRCDAILVGAGTVQTDTPSLDVRLPGLEHTSPRRIMLGRGDPPVGWEGIRTPQDSIALDCNSLLVEGGAQTAASFLRAGLVDRLLLYRAPILLGSGLPCLGDIGLAALNDAHNIWRLHDKRMLGKDSLEVYVKNSVRVL
jgi:diaminohydroxyphosphoribosylaminopyrimidine deaminase / 5-amino-6-(5-phosphoribosylamino)uracil reductase